MQLSRAGSMVQFSSVQMEDDAIFVCVKKALTSTAAHDDSHVSRKDKFENSKYVKKHRSISARREASEDDFCKLTALRQADENGTVKAEFFAAPDFHKLQDLKTKRSSSSRHSYNFESLSKLVEEAQEIESLEFQTVKQIRAGTLDRLVDCLVAGTNGETQIDNLHAQAFLATYRKFASTSEVLDAVLRHCVSVCSKNAVEAERVMQGYTSVVLLWIKSYPEDFFINCSSPATSPTANPSLKLISASQLTAHNVKQKEPSRRASVDAVTFNRTKGNPANLLTGEIVRSTRASSSLRSPQGSFYSLRKFVKIDVLDTFARFERSSKQDKFLKMLRKIRDWLSRMQPETSNGDALSGNTKKDRRRSSSNAPKISLTDRLLAFEPRNVAEALTLIDARLFREVRLYECLGAVWSQPLEVRARRATSVMQTIAQFNKLVQLIQSSVLDDINWSNHSRSPQVRAQLVSFWISVAGCLRTLKNFSSLKATVTSLTSTSLFRLNEVWSLVPVEQREVLADLEKLVSEKNNHELTRELLQKEGAAKTPDTRNPTDAQARLAVPQFGTIPYLGLFLTDLLYIHTAHNEHTEVDVSPKSSNGRPVTISGDVVGNGTKRKLVNFDKCRREFEVLARIKLLQSSTIMYLQNLQSDGQFEGFYSQFQVASVSETPRQSQAVPRSFSATPASASASASTVVLLSEDQCYKLSLELEKPVVLRSASSSSLVNGLRLSSNETLIADLLSASSSSEQTRDDSRLRNDTDSPVDTSRILRHLKHHHHHRRATDFNTLPASLICNVQDDADADPLSHSASTLPNGFCATAACVPKIGASNIAPLHRKTRSTDEKTGRLKCHSLTLNVFNVGERSGSDNETTTRNVRVKIDLDHPGNTSGHGAPHWLTLTARESCYQHGRTRLHASVLSKSHPAPPTLKQNLDEEHLSISMRSRGETRVENTARDIRRIATILNKFQTSTQFVDYKTIQIMNSDRKAQVIRKILAKFNLDEGESEADAHDCLDFCASNFDLVQLLSDGGELLISENTNIFYALKSEPGRTNASPNDEYVVALRLK